MPSLTGIAVSLLDAIDTGDQRNEDPNLDLGSKREEVEAEGLCHKSSRGYRAPYEQTVSNEEREQNWITPHNAASCF